MRRMPAETHALAVKLRPQGRGHGRGSGAKRDGRRKRGKGRNILTKALTFDMFAIHRRFLMNLK